jgi:hypothetical protein
MKKTYQKPTLTKGPRLATVTAVVCVSPFHNINGVCN